MEISKNLEELTRQLGAAIQKDEVFLNFDAARKANDADEELNALMGQIQLIQLNYQQEASKETPDDAKMQQFNKDFQEAYSKIMQNKNMEKFENARQAVDDMMNYLTAILAMCVNGEDPATCDPAAEHNCDGSCCSSCGGGCEH